MSLTDILKAEKTAPAKKLEETAKVVAQARDSYGNKDVEIAVPSVNTAHGAMPFNMLDADSKVEALKGELPKIKAKAVEFVKQNPGAVINKKIEELLATHPMFCNVDPGQKFDYI
jgi:hypothetical protein